MSRRGGTFWTDLRDILEAEAVEAGNRDFWFDDAEAQEWLDDILTDDDVLYATKVWALAQVYSPGEIEREG